MGPLVNKRVQLTQQKRPAAFMKDHFTNWSSFCEKFLSHTIPSHNLGSECISFLFSGIIKSLAHVPVNGTRVEHEKWLKVRNGLRMATKFMREYTEKVKGSINKIAPIRRITPNKKLSDNENPCLETYAPRIEASLCMENISSRNWFFHPFMGEFPHEETEYFSPYEKNLDSEGKVTIKKEGVNHNTRGMYEHNVYWLFVIRLEFMERYLRTIQLSIDVDREHFERVKGLLELIQTLETTINKSECSKTKIERTLRMIYDLRHEYRQYTRSKPLSEVKKELDDVVEYKKLVCHQISMWMQAHFPMAVIIRDVAFRNKKFVTDTALWNASMMDYLKMIPKDKSGRNVVKRYVKIWGKIMSSRRSIAYLLMPDDNNLFNEETMPNMNPFWQHVDFFLSRAQMKESAPEFQLFNKAVPQRCRARSSITILIKKCQEDKYISALMLHVMACTLMGYYKNVEYHPSLQLRMTYYRRFFMENISEYDFLAYISYPVHRVSRRDFLTRVSANQLKELVFFSMSQFMHCSVNYLTDLRKHIEQLYYWNEREDKLNQVIDTTLRVIDMNAFSHLSAEYAFIKGHNIDTERSYVSSVCSLLIYGVTEGSRVIPGNYPFLNIKRKYIPKECTGKDIQNIGTYISFRFSTLIKQTGRAFLPPWLIPGVIEKLMEEVKRYMNKNFAYRERKQPFHKICLKACQDEMMRNYCNYVMSEEYLGIDLDKELKSPYVKDLYIRNSAADKSITPRKVCVMLANLKSDEEARQMRESIDTMRRIFRKYHCVKGIKEVEFLRFFGVSEETTTKLSLAKNAYLSEGISTFIKDKIKEIPPREFPYVLTFFEELSRLFDYKIIKLPKHVREAQCHALIKKHNLCCPPNSVDKRCATFYFCPNEKKFKNIIANTTPSEPKATHSIAEVHKKKGLIDTRKERTKKKGRKIKRHKNITGTNNVSFDFMGNVYCAQRPVTQAKTNEITQKKILGIDTSEYYISVFSHYENTSWSGYKSVPITRELLDMVCNSIKKAMTSEKIAEAKEKDRIEIISKCEKTRVIPISLLGKGLIIDGELILMCCQCASPTVFKQSKCYNGLYYCVDCLALNTERRIEHIKMIYCNYEHLMRCCFYCKKRRHTMKGGNYRSYRVWNDLMEKPRFQEIWLCPKHVKQCGISSLMWCKASFLVNTIKKRNRKIPLANRRTSGSKVKVELVHKHPERRAAFPKYKSIT